MQVLYCFDENFLRVASVSIISLLKNNKNVFIHVFTNDKMDESSKCSLYNLVREYGGDICFYDVTKYMEKYKDIFKQSTNIFICARLIAAIVLPVDIKKVIYLDADTLIVGDLSDLWNADNSGFYIAAVYDMALPPIGAKENLELKKNDIYINSGVLCINLSLWRQDNLTEKFYLFCQQNVDLKYIDQDAINFVCNGKILLLDPKYNMTFITSELPYNVAKQILDKYTFFYYSPYTFLQSQNNPIVIHFATEIFGKPWYDVSNIRYTHEWRKYNALTPWAKMEWVERRYSNKSRILNGYKAICEKMLTRFYLRKNYYVVGVLYNIFYRIPHCIQKQIIGLKK